MGKDIRIFSARSCKEEAARENKDYPAEQVASNIGKLLQLHLADPVNAYLKAAKVPAEAKVEVSDSCKEGGHKAVCYISFNLDDRDKYYYKRAYLGCVRAVDFISQLPEYDGENLITMGNSQGGALSIVTAALDSRVKGVVAFYPALCDQVGYLYNQAGGWPHTFNNGKNNTPEKIKTVQYYDVVNFARYIKVPGFYSFGYNDSSTPPTSVFSALNMIKAPKEIFIAEETGHYSYPEQRNASWKWVRSFLETNKSDKDTKGKD